ncbi:hypothetical protein PROFUN_13492 [Planoprotostelium fungivorum]|uniref:Uncharacterized protein n=1 Tax=Planoprotostelium fungivorum TaxID=1890364 RepID=A0A2P6N3Y1_9EUKA|nr:hypothetical protein PROFUN_13492 [Planoprotostelium fungivorum]
MRVCNFTDDSANHKKLKIPTHRTKVLFLGPPTSLRTANITIGCLPSSNTYVRYESYNHSVTSKTLTLEPRVRLPTDIQVAKTRASISTSLVDHSHGLRQRPFFPTSTMSHRHFANVSTFSGRSGPSRPTSFFGFSESTKNSASRYLLYGYALYTKRVGGQPERDERDKEEHKKKPDWLKKGGLSLKTKEPTYNFNFKNYWNL